MKHESAAQNAPNHEEVYLNELVDVTAKKAVKAHDKSERFNELIEDAQKEAESYGADSTRIYDRVMAKVVDLEAKARSKRDSEAIKQYKGRVILIDKKYHPANDNGQYGDIGDDETDHDEMDDDEKKRRLSHAPAGLHKKTKVTVKNRLLWRNKRLDVQELDELMKHVEEKEAEIRKYELRIKLLKASQKNTRKLAKDMAGFIQDSQGNWFTSGEWVRVAARSLKQEAGKHYDEKNTVKALAKVQKKIEGKKSELKMAMEEITTLQDRGLGIFKANFGSKEDPESEIGLLLANKAEMDQEEYDKDIKALRERVRKFGEKNGIIYMEYYLNQVLGIKPGVMQVSATEADGGIKLKDKTSYTVPVDKKEIAREKFVIEKRWKEIFGATAVPGNGEVVRLIMGLRNNDPKFLKLLLTNPNVVLPTDNPYVIVLKFLFTGRSDSDAVLGVEEMIKPLTAQNILKAVKDIPKLIEKVGSTGDLKTYLEVFGESELKGTELLNSFDYLQGQINHIQKDKYILAAEKTFKTFTKNELSAEDANALLADLETKTGINDKDTLLELLTKPEYQVFYDFYCKGKIFGEKIGPLMAARNRWKISSYSEFADLVALTHKIRTNTPQLLPNEATKVFNKYIYDPGYGGLLKDLDFQKFEEILAEVRGEAQAAPPPLPTPTPAPAQAYTPDTTSNAEPPIIPRSLFAAFGPLPQAPALPAQPQTPQPAPDAGAAPLSNTLDAPTNYDEQIADLAQKWANPNSPDPEMVSHIQNSYSHVRIAFKIGSELTYRVMERFVADQQNQNLGTLLSMDGETEARLRFFTKGEYSPSTTLTGASSRHEIFSYIDKHVSALSEGQIANYLYEVLNRLDKIRLIENFEDFINLHYYADRSDDDNVKALFDALDYLPDVDSQPPNGTDDVDMGERESVPPAEDEGFDGLHTEIPTLKQLTADQLLNLTNQFYPKESPEKYGRAYMNIGNCFIANEPNMINNTWFIAEILKTFASIPGTSLDLLLKLEKGGVLRAMRFFQTGEYYDNVDPNDNKDFPFVKTQVDAMSHDQKVNYYARVLSKIGTIEKLKPKDFAEKIDEAGSDRTLDALLAPF